MFDFEKYVSDGSAVLISTDVNRRYISGFVSSLGYLLVSKTGIFLFVDGRYYEAAKKGVNQGIEVILLERLGRQLNDYFEKLSIKTLYVETEITVGTLKMFEDILNVHIAASTELSEELLAARSVKTEYELECIEKAQRIAEKAFTETLNLLKPGISEKAIALELDYRMQKYGSEGVSFETIVVAGPNSALPHGVPGTRPIRTGEFIVFDFGAVYNGYHSDMTRTVALRRVSDKMQYVYDLVLKAQNAVLDNLKAGLPCSVADAFARDIITADGYAGNFNHGTGHGVGLEIHEYPNLSPRSKTKLIENQVVTVEPGVYLPGEFGVRIEDMAIVKNNNCKNLTNTEKTLIIF